MVTPRTLDLARDLNPQQLAAVIHGEGPQLVLAGAGSGKTRVITYRVAWLVHQRGVAPDTIVAVTFTNKAAAEMRERIEGLLGISPLPTFVGTFHRFALGLLRRYGERVGVLPGFVIFDADDQLALVKQAMAAEGLSETAFVPRAVTAAISAAKNRLLTPEAYEQEADGFFQRQVAPVFRRYQGLLREASGVDFDDMLALAVQLLVEHPDLRQRLRQRIRYLLVDEFQDTNHAQLRLIEELAGPTGNVTAVGDEDQGIYRWRGADLANILRFEATFPQAMIRKLERNYRSTQTILTAASALVAHNRHRLGKRLWTDAGAGEPIELYRARDEQDEARWVVATLNSLASRYRWGEMAVLVRTNAQTRVLEEELLRHQIPYILVGGVRFYARAEVKDVVAYLRVIRNPRDSFSLGRILNHPPRGIGKATQELLEQTAAGLRQPVWDLLLHDELGGFPVRGAKALRDFRDLILALQAAAVERPLPAFLQRLLRDSGLLDLYSKPDAESRARLENLDEILSAVEEFAERAGDLPPGEVLTAFLDHVSLVSDLDEWQAERGVSLMTLHSAKGLEFPAVVVAGLENGLLPHFNASDTEEDWEEERRLLHVGMTRAKERLFLTCCRRRRIAGRYQERQESPFLSEIPQETLQVTASPELFHDERTEGIYSFFGRQPGATPDGEEEVRTGVGPGSRVRHPTLGAGVILDLEGEGEETKLTVFFERVGKRKLVAKYAHLEPL